MRTELQTWLESCKCFDVRPCTVTIGRTTYQAARYKQTLVPCRGANRPEPYTREMVYCIGKAPQPRRKTCYTLAGDAREWYVAGYADPTQPIKPEHRDYNPFGHNFLLAPWTAAGRVDAYERRPYDRRPVTIVEA